MTLDQFGNYICDIAPDPITPHNPGTGGGGGATEAFFVSGDPNGVTTATRPAIAYDANGSIWLKTSSGSSNTGWEQRL